MPTSSEPCRRPNCSGFISDGFCADCGRPPLGQSAISPASGGNGAHTPAGDVSALDARAQLFNAATPAATPPASSASTPITRAQTAFTAPSSAPLSHGTTPSAPSTLGNGTSQGSSPSQRGTAKSGRNARSGSTRRQLGAGLVALEPLPSLDPLASLMQDASVPERKKFCPHCNAKLSKDKGFCPMCGLEYSFLPTLQAGDILAGQYEIKGPMAFGGLGWIYLGWDLLLSRWVVLKGLLNTKDASSAQAAVQERKFLASVKHPNIVGVYNFVSHGPEGYIVMEYVGGQSLKTLRQERGPLAPPEAVAYVHRILGAFSYLERMGLVYCDFKPDNFMLEGDDVKLIDMGGVRREDDPGGDVYGTKGYSAPEASDAPSHAADLYTVARTLAVLLITFPFTAKYEFSLPTPVEEPLFAQHESLYRWLLKATRARADERFASFEEAAEQLLGVLREIVSLTGTPKPHDSAYFSPGELTPSQEASAFALPALKIDAHDPAANALLSAGAVPDPLQRGAAFKRLYLSYPDSSEVPLRWAEALFEGGDFDGAEALLSEVFKSDRLDWRVWWYRGKGLLMRGTQHMPAYLDANTRQTLNASVKRHYPEARACFERVYAELPGELAPKLALAVAAEREDKLDVAARFYELVARTDPTYVGAAFGLARVLLKKGDRGGAASALVRVPNTSSHHLSAQVALARALSSDETSAPTANELFGAGSVIEGLRGTLDGFHLHRLSADVLLMAAMQLEAGHIKPNNHKLLNRALDARDLRRGVERELRECARYAQTPGERTALIDEANRERPRTLF